VAAPDTHGRDQALVVGGSGMLAGLCRRLAIDGWQVSIVGRDRTKLVRATGDDARLHPVSVDYEHLDAFAAALDEVAAARGPISLAVCWIRSWAPQSLLAAADRVAVGGRLFHVLGSQASDASAAAIADVSGRHDLHYRQVQLGSVADGAEWRSLTDDEISDGVYAAIAADGPYHLVGILRP
jgi:NAD(P)-dependent dehydrogenase (short-subunit alcohol dehydrogenase family)